MLVIRERIIHRGNDPEREFEARSYEIEDGGYTAVRVHPWARYNQFREDYDREVFVSVGNYEADGSEWGGAGPNGEPVWNILVDREEFVQGLLETFPELRRADA